MNELYHHGIKGQKWGVKNGPPYPLSERSLSKSEKRAKYVNADGTLTRRGKAVARNIRKKQIELDNEIPWASGVTEEHPELIKNGVGKINSNSAILKKGQTITRYTNNAEDVDHRVKYVSLTERDEDMYDEFASNGKLGFNGTPVRERYKTEKDLKIASPKAVIDYFVDKYGDEPMKNFGGTDEGDYGIDTYVRVLKDYDRYLGNTDLAGRSQRIVADYIDSGRNQVANLMRQKIYRDVKASSEMYEHFRSVGYDAIVDVEDYFGSTAQYPLIILDPADSVKKISSERNYR